ncbi:hypothetical protein [Lysinibacillus sp. NPDC086135]|uniref:hypothetical protein n=1 Tax=Lysinibacillus sp. NPDC086135 TaxID=3364130 RepID=UPI0037F5F72D
MVKYYYDKYEAKLAKTLLKTFTNVSEEDPSSLFRTLYPGVAGADLYETLKNDPYLTIENKSPYTLGQGLIYYLYESVWGNTEYFFGFYDADPNESMVGSVQIDASSIISFYLYGVRWAEKDKLTYQRGSLVQSNIQAENGTYPANGRHTDGFWYVRSGLVNTAPTQPGAFTQPSGTLETGDSKVFTVGASTDAESNLSKYIWEVSVNNAIYSKAGETTTSNFPYTIPNATSLKMRVKAVDSGGLESAYRESSLFTVTKPIYYWSKYNVNTNVTYIEPTWGAERSGYDSEFTGKAKSYSWNSSTGKFVLSGSVYSSSETVSDGMYAYAIFGTELYRYKWDYGNYPANNSGGKYAAYKNSSDASTNTTTTKGSLVQSNIQAEEGIYPVDGRHTDGYWYVRGSRVSQSIAPPSPFTEPISGKKFKPGETANITFGASSAANVSLYEVDLRYNSTGTWSQLPYNNTLIRSWTITTNKSLKTIEFRVRAKNTSSVYSDYVYSEPFVIEDNVAPTVSLTSPTENVTLYENDILNIAGTAYDADSDQSVTIYYQINSEQRKVLATNISQTQIALSKQLKFKGSKLYDGDTVLTGILTDGVAQKLKVWATDSEGASSIIIEKSFYVVPNRAPLLSIDTVVPSGVVDNDSFKISGNATDHDENSTLKVTQRINSGNSVEIYSGTGGVWEFEVALAQLNVGENVIVVEVIDNYGAKTSKTIKLNKNEVKTPILQSVARYKIEPPKGTAKGVLLFIERDRELDLKVELSMTLAGEQEQYETLTPEGTAPMSYDDNIVEDTFYYETTEPKDKIVLKLSTTRPDATVNHKIHLISGAVE